MSARIKLPDELSGLLRSELERAIYESAFNREDELIARRYLIEKTAQADIAAEIGYERSTISRRLPCIIERVKYTAKKLEFT